VQTVRVTDVKVLDAPVERVTGEVRSKGGVSDPSTELRAGSGSVFLVNHNADIALATLRYKLKDASFEAAEERSTPAGRIQPRLVHHQRIRAADVQKTATELGLQVVREHGA